MAIPIKRADKIVNIKACIKATSNSIAPINTTKKTETGATAKELKINTKHNSDSTRMCPAVIFANKRIINAKGFVKIPKISTGIINGFSHHGTGGLKICPQ